MVKGPGPSDDETARQDAEDRRTERLVRQLAQQWGQVRRTSREQAAEPVIEGGESNFSRAEVPWAYDLAAAWAWRFIVITVAVLMVLYAISVLAVVVFPVVIALFIAALAAPVVGWIERTGASRKVAALVVVVGGVAAIVLLLFFVTQQVTSSAGELSEKVSDGLG
ncbi:MAG: AI-2E family transporter, partial [Marmoricola sp.]